MATLKHIASKNSDYTAIEAYLIYQHDAFTGKQLLDEQGRPMLRESYILDTLECGDFSFATACLLANRKYGKNTQHGDIKSHQYIISFDPRDAADNGLTMEKAQALGLKFCSENFPGHPAIVCTHPDGHNHSGNIHVHIVIGSIRTREVERKPYMQKPRDWREGMKHSSTAQTMRHLRVEVMELCEGAIGKLIDIQSRMTEGKGIGYKRWLTKHNLKVMAQTVKLLQEKGLTDEDVLNQRIAELETKYHDSLAVVKDLEGRMKANNELRYHVAAYASTKSVAQQLKTAKRPAAFEEQHRAELTAYRAAAAYLKANNITKLPSPKKLEAEYAQLASEKAKFYEQYKETKEELLKLKTAKQNVASFFREEEPAQQER
jgi:hypothetical protein